MKLRFCLVLCVFVGGCSAKYSEPAAPDESPANASAQESPAAARSRTLELAHAEPGSGAPASRHDHGKGSGAAGSAPPVSPPAPAPSTDPAGGAPAPVVYVCPMHPEVTSEDADARCPKCNMRLKKVEPKAGGSR